MKHIKLFERYEFDEETPVSITDEDKPRSITLELLPEFYNKIKEANGSVTDGSYGYADPKNIQLVDHSTDGEDRSNLCCVATLDSTNMEYNYGGSIAIWIKYSKDGAKISMYESVFDRDNHRKLMEYASNLSSMSPIYKGLWRDTNQNNVDYNRRLTQEDAISKGRREDWNFFNYTGYCDFEDGVEIGKVDHRGYFRIVEVK